MTIGDSFDDRRRHIAKQVVDTMLADQIGRSESLGNAAAALAGLAGVVTTLAGIVPRLTTHVPGIAGISAAALSALLAVAGLTVRRPGREPVGIGVLVDHIFNTGDITLTEDVLIEADVQVAQRNDGRLRIRGQLVAV